MDEQTDLRLTFLDVAMFDDGTAIRGGVLITDIETKPYEFRCTSSVKPTSMQRMLYGNTLEEYIYVELIGVPLIKATKEKPGLVLVRSEKLLRIRPSLACPVILIRRDPRAANLSSSDGEAELKPVVLSAHREYATEKSAAEAMLASLMQKRDPLEPFERVQVALVEAHKKQIGDTEGK